MDEEIENKKFNESKSVRVNYALIKVNPQYSFYINNDPPEEFS